ncbi:Synaptogyrin-2 [Liparis tanakae]|uniref:Synaptogyrin n=1 Tax=Liparis tanakae TaxID=230148 RepID=A0A4Z2I3Y7_9TELE|nr:Synaptogyrin-2 [Liparis tanakae]
MQSSAYGASLAGGAFDLLSFVKQPQTILRCLSWVFAIVVFATITAEGYTNASTSETANCMFNNDNSACSYGVGIGVLAFSACVVFLILDGYFPQISNAKERRLIVVGDLVFSGAWTFLWFVCFCVLASQWAKTPDTAVVPADAARAVVAFSFFSTVTWGLLSYFAFVRYREGVGSLDQDYRDPANDQSTPYPAAPYNSGPTGYQQSPFPQSQEQPGEYQPPPAY